MINITCSGHGTLVNGQCECERLYQGARCQYETMCQEDSDCNGPKGQGKCVSGMDSKKNLKMFEFGMKMGGWARKLMFSIQDIYERKN